MKEAKESVSMQPDFSQAVTQMREILAGSDFPDENHRKAALRRALHGSAAGLTIEEIEELVASLRQRFPDRSYETANLARELERTNGDLKKELARLQSEHDELQRSHQSLQTLVEGLFSTASQLKGGRIATGGAPLHATRKPEKLTPLFSAIEETLKFAAQQESISQQVEGLLAQKSGKEGRSIAELFSRLTRSDEQSDGDLELLRVRLRQLGLGPAAMMAGVQQSWKGGTTQLLEYLDPVKCEEAVQGKLPGLRDVAVLKEVKNRFQEFWTRLDDNVDHYYRGTFERVYRDKMEERQ